MQLTACQKIFDKYLRGHGNDNSCKIVSIKQEGRTGTFYYNEQGKPDSVIFDISFGTGGGQFFYFKYDEHHKLVEYKDTDDHTGVDFYTMHRYGYSGDRIVTDSQSLRFAGDELRIFNLEYDGDGRVVKELGISIQDFGNGPEQQPLDPIMYYYDPNGNLVSPPVNAYDDKVSFLRTNKVWMFIERNYSKNNPVGAVGYNSNDLPLGFATDTRSGFLHQNSLPTEIQYDCQ
jgi:hypothetical protein